MANVLVQTADLYLNSIPVPFCSKSMTLASSEAHFSVDLIYRISFFLHFVNFVHEHLNAKDSVSDKYFFTEKKCLVSCSKSKPNFVKIKKSFVKFRATAFWYH